MFPQATVNSVEHWNGKALVEAVPSSENKSRIDENKHRKS